MGHRSEGDEKAGPGTWNLEPHNLTTTLHLNSTQLFDSLLTQRLRSLVLSIVSHLSVVLVLALMLMLMLMLTLSFSFTLYPAAIRDVPHSSETKRWLLLLFLLLLLQTS